MKRLEKAIGQDYGVAKDRVYALTTNGWENYNPATSDHTRRRIALYTA